MGGRAKRPRLIRSLGRLTYLEGVVPSHRRMSVAVPIGRRGAGLGNEAFALAKAYLGAVTCRAQLIEQPWWLNPRRYDQQLGRNWRRPLLARGWGLHVPVIDLDFIDLTQPWDYARSMSDISGSLPSSFVLRHISQMRGGFLSIRSARPFLQQRLLRPLPEQDHRTLRIGVHIRRGDFTSRLLEPGVFNAQLPLAWTINAIRALLSCADEEANVLVFTDSSADSAEIRAIVESFRDYRVSVAGGPVLEDLSALSACDFIVPSVSTFSMLAIFLSSAAYVWPREHLVEHRKGLSLWGFEDEVLAGPTGWALAKEGDVVPRAVALATNDHPDISDWMLEAKLIDDWPWESDLIQYGVLRTGRPT